MVQRSFEQFGSGRSRMGHHGRNAIAPNRVGSFERLESRMLMSYSPSARIMNGDVVDEQHPRIVNGAPTTGFSAVGEVGDRSGMYCTGTLISDRYVLTAGHCAEGVRANQGRFVLDSGVYTTSQVFVHPDYNGNRIGVSDAANDVAIFQLSAPVAGVTPDPIFHGTPQVGDVLTLVGFGATGTGATGHDGSFGTRRAGTTPIDGMSPRRILWTFDNNRESNTAPGDSGGPAYLLVDGVYYVAGITSGGSRPNAGIGDHSFDTRVDYYADWIDSIVGSSPFVPPDGDPSPVVDDHPDLPGPDATVLDISPDGGVFGSGSLETAGDRDVFRVDVSERGTLSLDLEAVSGSLDTYIRVYDAAGNLLASDDDSGAGTDSRLSVLLQPGVAYISAGSYNDFTTGSYQLSGSFSDDDHANTFVGATHIALSAAGDGQDAGVIGNAGDRDMFQIVANRGGHMAIDLQAGGDGLDPVLTVYDSRGRTIALNDDFGSTADSHVVFRVRAGSSYYIQSAGYQGTLGSYSIAVSPTRARHVAGARSAATVLPPVLAECMAPAGCPASATSPSTSTTNSSPAVAEPGSAVRSDGGQPGDWYAALSFANVSDRTDTDAVDAVLADAVAESNLPLQI